MERTQLTVQFGTIKDYPEATINYAGDGECGIVITIEFLGPVTGIRVNNTTRGEYLILNDDKIAAVVGSGIEQYDLIKIDTTRGNKSATLSRGGITYNILHAVDLSSKWIYLQYGDNHFTYTATTGFDYMSVTLECQVKVLGV